MTLRVRNALAGYEDLPSPHMDAAARAAEEGFLATERLAASASSEAEGVLGYPASGILDSEVAGKLITETEKKSIKKAVIYVIQRLNTIQEGALGLSTGARADISTKAKNLKALFWSKDGGTVGLTLDEVEEVLDFIDDPKV